MQTKNGLMSLMAAGLMLAGSGCSTRLGSFTVLSTQNVSIDKKDLDKLPQVNGVTGKDSRFIFLFFPLPFGPLKLQTAVDDALKTGGGDVMTDVVISTGGWWFLIGETNLKVKGTVVNTRGTVK